MAVLAASVAASGHPCHEAAGAALVSGPQLDGRNLTIRFFQQPLDHFGFASSAGSLQQRYLVWEPPSPSRTVGARLPPRGEMRCESRACARTQYRIG